MTAVRKPRKGHRTATFKPYGRRPFRDAKADAMPFALVDDDIIEGKKKAPRMCAIARGQKRLTLAGAPEAIPGLLAIEILKTSVRVAREHKGNIIVERYLQSNAQSKRIKAFDEGAEGALKAGDIVTLFAPKGRERLGKSNGTPGPSGFVAKNPRPHTRCQRRGVFVDPIHEKQSKVK